MKKKIIAVILAVFLAILLIPSRQQVKDGGTVVYKAILYTVKDVHKFKPTEPNSKQEFYEGIIVEIFGTEIFNNVK